MEIILALALGVTLSAASGFRLFLPPLILSLAALHGDLELASGFGWLGTYPTAIALGMATVAEILAYYIPVVDNLLDAIEVPVAVTVGTLLTAATLTEINSLWLLWIVAAIAGGGTAGILAAFTAVTRLAFTGLTGGMGNFLVATTEALAAGILSLLALTLLPLAAALVIGLLVMAIVRLLKVIAVRKQKRSQRSI